MEQSLYLYTEKNKLYFLHMRAVFSDRTFVMYLCDLLKSELPNLPLSWE